MIKSNDIYFYIIDTVDNIIEGPNNLTKTKKKKIATTKKMKKKKKKTLVINAFDYKI